MQLEIPEVHSLQLSNASFVLSSATPFPAFNQAHCVFSPLPLSSLHCKHMEVLQREHFQPAEPDTIIAFHALLKISWEGGHFSHIVELEWYLAPGHLWDKTLDGEETTEFFIIYHCFALAILQWTGVLRNKWIEHVEDSTCQHDIWALPHVFL